ncbi:MAG TPA: hypothetical protein VNU46_04840 [Gemmatimonadaceae bacterium]|nr:hypothetical protein [Gemmatimonadaceae bacterium]
MEGTVTSDREQIEGTIMMESVLPSFLSAARARAEAHPAANDLVAGLIAVLESNAKAAEEGEDGLWTAAAALARAIFEEQWLAQRLIDHSQELDKRDGYAWKTLCTLCYIGASLDPHALPILSVNLHMAIAEFVYKGTHHLPELYEKAIVDWFTAYWQRIFADARYRFWGPRLVEMDLRTVAKSDPQVRLQRLLRAMATGLSTSLPERGREWFEQAGW